MGSTNSFHYVEDAMEVGFPTCNDRQVSRADIAVFGEAEGCRCGEAVILEQSARVADIPILGCEDGEFDVVDPRRCCPLHRLLDAGTIEGAGPDERVRSDSHSALTLSVR